MRTGDAASCPEIDSTGELVSLTSYTPAITNPSIQLPFVTTLTAINKLSSDFHLISADFATAAISTSPSLGAFNVQLDQLALVGNANLQTLANAAASTIANLQSKLLPSISTSAINLAGMTISTAALQIKGTLDAWSFSVYTRLNVVAAQAQQFSTSYKLFGGFDERILDPLASYDPDVAACNGIYLQCGAAGCNVVLHPLPSQVLLNSFVPLNLWSQLVITRDEFDAVSVYFDGQAVFRASTGSWTWIGADILHFFHQPPISSRGSCAVSAPLPLPADIARVRIFPNSLTSDEVTALNADGVPPVATYPTSDILVNAAMGDLVPASALFPVTPLYPPLTSTFLEYSGSAYQLTNFSGNQGFVIPTAARITNGRSFTVSLVLQLSGWAPSALVSLVEFANVADLSPTSTACTQQAANTTLAAGFYLYDSHFQYYEQNADYRQNAVFDPLDTYQLTDAMLTSALVHLAIVRNQSALYIYYNGVPMGVWATNTPLLQSNVLRILSEPCARAGQGVVARVRTFNTALGADQIQALGEAFMPPTPSADVDFRLQSTLGANLPLRTDVSDGDVGNATSLALQPYLLFVAATPAASQGANASETDGLAPSQLFAVDTIEDGRERYVMQFAPYQGINLIALQASTVNTFTVSLLLQVSESQDHTTIFFIDDGDDGCNFTQTGLSTPPMTAFKAPALWVQSQHLYFVYEVNGSPVVISPIANVALSFYDYHTLTVVVSQLTWLILVDGYVTFDFTLPSNTFLTSPDQLIWFARCGGTSTATAQLVSSTGFLGRMRVFNKALNVFELAGLDVLTGFACPNECFDRGQCVTSTGQCVCGAGYSGVDCSVTTPATLDLNAPIDWQYLQAFAAPAETAALVTTDTVFTTTGHLVHAYPAVNSSSLVLNTQPYFDGSTFSLVLLLRLPSLSNTTSNPNATNTHYRRVLSFSSSATTPQCSDPRIDSATGVPVTAVPGGVYLVSNGTSLAAFATMADNTGAFYGPANFTLNLRFFPTLTYPDNTHYVQLVLTRDEALNSNLYLDGTLLLSFPAATTGSFLPYSTELFKCGNMDVSMARLRFFDYALDPSHLVSLDELPPLDVELAEFTFALDAAAAALRQPRASAQQRLAHRLHRRGVVGAGHVRPRLHRRHRRGPGVRAQPRVALLAVGAVAAVVARAQRLDGDGAVQPAGRRLHPAAHDIRQLVHVHTAHGQHQLHSALRATSSCTPTVVAAHWGATIASPPTRRLPRSPSTSSAPARAALARSAR